MSLPHSDQINHPNTQLCTHTCMHTAPHEKEKVLLVLPQASVVPGFLTQTFERIKRAITSFSLSYSHEGSSILTIMVVVQGLNYEPH